MLTIRLLVYFLYLSGTGSKRDMECMRKISVCIMDEASQCVEPEVSFKSICLSCRIKLQIISTFKEFSC